MFSRRKVEKPAPPKRSTRPVAPLRKARRFEPAKTRQPPRKP